MMMTADTTGYVGPRLRATVAEGGVVAFALAPPVTLDEIHRSGELGTTWVERGVLHATCARCGLGRPTSHLKPVDGHWYCDDEAPKEK